MPVTQLAARTEVRSLLNEVSPVFWTNAQLNSWIYQGTEDVARRAENLWEEANIECVALQQIYPFAPDFLNCHRAEFVLAGNLNNINTPQGITSNLQTYNVEYREINAMDEIWGVLHGLPQAWPQYFTIRGNSVNGLYLFLYPAPGAQGVLTVYYYRQARQAAVDNSYIDVQPGWEDCVYDYAVYKAMRMNRDPAWQEAFQLYEGKLAQMIDKTRSFTDLGSQITTGVPQWPVYAYGSGDVW